MRKLGLALALLIAFALPARAQYTNVSGTVVDPNAIPYAYANVKATLVTAGGAVTGQPTVSGTCHTADKTYPCQLPVDQTIGPINLDENGTFSVQIADNALITPASTQWQFVVSTTDTQGTDHGVVSPLGFGARTFSVTLTITGASVDVSSNLNSAALALARVVGGGVPGGQRWDQLLNPNSNLSPNFGGATFNFTNGAWSFAGMSFVLPQSAGCVASATNSFCLDTSLNEWHAWIGADATIALLPLGTYTDGDVLGIHVVAGQKTLQDLGGVNPTSGLGFLQINMTSPLDGDIPCYDSTGPPLWNNCTPGIVGNAITGATNSYLISISDNVTRLDHDAAASVSAASRVSSTSRGR